MSIWIKNAANTSKLKPPFLFNSWLEYWESKKGKIDEFRKCICPAEDCHTICYRSDFDGCHVQKVGDPIGKMYIIPLCSGCNHRNDFFLVDENLLVPAP